MEKIDQTYTDQTHPIDNPKSWMDDLKSWMNIYHEIVNTWYDARQDQLVMPEWYITKTYIKTEQEQLANILEVHPDAIVADQILSWYESILSYIATEWNSNIYDFVHTQDFSDINFTETQGMRTNEILNEINHLQQILRATTINISKIDCDNRDVLYQNIKILKNRIDMLIQTWKLHKDRNTQCTIFNRSELWI